MAQPVPNLVLKEFDANGLPLAGGKLYSYAAGTTTPQETFTDATAGTPNTNPVILDANGEASVWIDQRGYKFILTDASDNVQWTRDGIFLVENGSITSEKLADGSVTPDKMDLSTLTSSDLPANLIDTNNIKDGAVTPSKIPDGSIPFEKIDPDLDLTKFNQTCEVVFSSKGIMGDGVIQATPQYPWATPSLLSNPASIPAGSSGQPKWTRDGKLLAIPHATSPYITIYSRQGSALTKLSDPDILPSGQATDCAWSPDGQMLAVASSSGTTCVYRRSGNTFQRIKSPSNTAPTGVAWSPDGQYLAITNNTSPYLYVYGLNRKTIISEETGNNVCWLVTTSAQTGFLYPGMANIISGGATFVIASVPNANQVVIESLTGLTPSGTISFNTSTLSGSITVSSAQPISFSYEYFQWSAAAISPTSPPPVSGGVAPTQPKWTPDGQFVSLVTSGSPYMAMYQFTGSALNLVTAPTSIPSAACSSDAWSPSGQYLAIGLTASPYIYVYQWNGSVLTLLTAPSTLPTGSVTGLSWSANGKYLALAMQASPYVMIYSFDGTTFTALAQPTSLPTGNANGVAWSPSNQFLCATGTTTPYIFTYKTSGSIPSNSLLYVREVLDV